MRHASWKFVPAIAAAVACGACAATAVAPADTASVLLKGHRFDVEVADTPPAREHGLMDRTGMPVDHGMLFVFPDSQPRTFWMKDTLIPLDILFFDNARKLVAIQAKAQPCKTDPCKLYPSVVPARYVVELNAGTAAKLRLRKGDAITFSEAPSGTQ